MAITKDGIKSCSLFFLCFWNGGILTQSLLESCSQLFSRCSLNLRSSGKYLRKTAANIDSLKNFCVIHLSYRVSLLQVKVALTQNAISDPFWKKRRSSGIPEFVSWLFSQDSQNYCFPNILSRTHSSVGEMFLKWPTYYFV